MMFTVGVDGENVRVIQFTCSLCFTQEAAVKIFVRLFIHGGTRQENFDGHGFT